MRVPAKFRDFFVVLCLLLITATFAFSVINFSIQPHEDAAILMRYTRNFSQGHDCMEYRRAAG